MDGDEEIPHAALYGGKVKEGTHLDSVNRKGDGVDMTETERMKLI